MECENKFEKSVDIAKEMIECGGEIFRAEETILRINKNDDCNVFAIPSLIIAQSNEITQIRRIYKEDIDLTRLAQLNSLSRKMSGEVNFELKNQENYSKIVYELSYFGATASFCFYFGGGILDAIITGIIAIIMTYSSYNQIEMPIFSKNLIQAFIAGVLAFLPKVFNISCNPDKIIIGAIMLLVPGLTIVNGTRDIMNSDLVAGSIEILNSIMSALGIAFGITGAILIFSLL